MKRWLNFTLLVAFLFCYLEWPPNNSMFIFQAEYEIFVNSKNWISNFTHPLLLIGLLAQALLLYCAIRKDANKKINTVSIILLGVIVLFFLFIGLLSSNYKIISSTLPYLSLSVFYFITFRNKK